jgi:hypothetical protein
MSNEPDYVVLRRSPDLPSTFRVPREGWWFDRARMIEAHPEWVGSAVAVPTGRFEFREDGAVAEVYEVRP